MLKILTLLVLICHVANVHGLKCYTCTTTENDKDKRCITNPASVEGNGITNCNKNYCTTTRVEYLDPKDKVQSMNRDCVDKPIFSNQVQEDSTFRVYYTSCRTDLCNSGTGKDISTGGGIIYEDGAEIVLYVPGLGKNSAISLQGLNIIIVTILSLVFYFI